LRRIIAFSQAFAVNTSATYGDRRMPEYVLGHHLKGEGKRLAVMSELLDPMHRRFLQSLDVLRSGASTLEVGCGNGSISAWLALRLPRRWLIWSSRPRCIPQALL
jgi:hypothetical protein